MNSGSVTTPFGRRSMTFGMIACQVASHEIDPNKSVDKWKIYRALCEAKPLLGISDRALAILNALLSFYPKPDLSEGDSLIVFPSNAQLSLRSHGMAEQTIRRHLSTLVNSDLLIRKDSPNGKRYARKGRGGEISEAFGFSLAPLLARSEEIEKLADQVVTERHQRHQLQERITLCRRDISKLMEMDSDQNPCWMTVSTRMQDLLLALPRRATTAQLETLLCELQLLRETAVNELKIKIKTQNQSGSSIQNERHIQNTELDSYLESERSCEKDAKDGSFDVVSDSTNSETDEFVQPKDNLRSRPDNADQTKTLKSFPLSILLQACPQISDYASGGVIRSWHDLTKAAVVVRSMLGVSTSAYEEAEMILGRENAATVIACILERSSRINSAGGYLRDLTRRAERGKFALGPMLMSLARLNTVSSRYPG